MLGYDFFAQNNCCLDLVSGELQFGELPKSPYEVDEFNETQCCSITSNQDAISPFESELMLIPAYFIINFPALNAELLSLIHDDRPRHTLSLLRNMIKCGYKRSC